MEPWVSVDNSLLVTYKTHTRTPCVYIYTQRASQLLFKVSSSAWWCARRPDHFSTCVAQHTTHAHPARWREYSRRTQAPVWQRAHAWETDRQQHTTRRSVVHRLVVGLIPIRTIGLVFSWFSVYYQWIRHIICILHMLCIYMEIAINGTRGIALYAPILRI